MSTLKQFFKKVHRFFALNFNTITIKKANIFTTLVIFVFTIIFAYLLIKENYHDYERALNKQHQLFVSNNIDVMQEQELENNKALKTLLIKNTVAIVTLAFIIFAIMIGIYKIFSTLLERDVEAFLTFFKNTAHNEQDINPHAMFFKEFKTMGKYANEMVHIINHQNKTLKELNTTLEDKVKSKTKNMAKILNAQKEFIRYAVHETNTPLSVILTSLELYEMNHEKNKHLSKIEAATKNIFSIYDDLSYLVKKDQVVYKKMTIDIEQFVKSRLSFFSEVAHLSKLDFRFESHIDELYIYFNETQLQRIVDNTLTNAIKYTYQNEIIDVVLRKSSLHVALSVSSHSREIKDVEKIFDEYYREENDDIQGFGIGLRLVKNICDEEDVDIIINSTHERNEFIYKFKVMGV